MSLKVKRLESADFDKLRSLRHSTQGHLSAAATDVGFPSTDDATADRRQAWSFKQQASFLADPTAHLLKVVDVSRAPPEDVLALARWHHYTSPPFYSSREFAGDLAREAESYPQGMHADLYDSMLDQIFQERSKWMVPGSRWVLTNLKTREAMRGKGAGTALIEWGVEQALKDGCPAYLEAAAEAVSLYKRCGFHEFGELAVDLSSFGMQDPVIIKLMAANLHK